MAEEQEVKPKKRTGLIVFLTILIILLVAALAVFATLYFTGSDLLKFNKEEVVKEDEEEVETKTSKKTSKTEKEDNSTSKTDSKTNTNTSKDLGSLITGGNKNETKNTTTPSITDLPTTTTNKTKTPVTSSVFTSVLDKNGIKCEANVGTTGVNELYIGYAEDQKSSASYIKFDKEEDCTKYYNEQRDNMTSSYSTSGTVKKDAGTNWESLRISFTGSTSMIYMERVGNVLIAISTDDSTVFKNMESMIKSLGY